MTLHPRQSSRYPQDFYEKEKHPVNKFDPGVNPHYQGSVKRLGWIYYLGSQNSMHLILRSWEHMAAMGAYGPLIKPGTQVSKPDVGFCTASVCCHQVGVSCHLCPLDQTHCSQILPWRNLWLFTTVLVMLSHVAAFLFPWRCYRWFVCLNYRQDLYSPQRTRSYLWIHWASLRLEKRA